MPRLSWRSVAFLGLTLLVLGNGGVVWAEQYVPSGLAAVLVAASPFWMIGVEAFTHDGEPVTLRGVVGLVVGFGGILLLVWPDLVSGGAGSAGFLAGVVSLQIACLGWALGSSYSRRHARDQNILATTAAQMFAGAVMMLAIGAAAGEWRVVHFNERTASALVYLMTIGAIGGFVSYTYALRHLPVSLVSLYAYVNPVIAVALGAAFLAEPFTPRMAFAAALVFVGVAIVKAPGRARERSSHGRMVGAAGAHRAR
jgi:drug/metabolite transporter (DMT)-like permease